MEPTNNTEVAENLENEIDTTIDTAAETAHEMTDEEKEKIRKAAEGIVDATEPTDEMGDVKEEEAAV